MIYKIMMEYRPLIEKTASGIEADEFSVFCAQCGGYLLGEDISEPGKHITKANRLIYHEVAKKTPAAATKVRKIPIMDACFAAVLDYKDETLTELLGDEWTNTPEGKRVDSIIRETPASIEDNEDYKYFRDLITKL